jgi:hypothetical protein
VSRTPGHIVAGVCSRDKRILLYSKKSDASTGTFTLTGRRVRICYKSLTEIGQCLIDR